MGKEKKKHWTVLDVASDMMDVLNKKRPGSTRERTQVIVENAKYVYDVISEGRTQKTPGPDNPADWEKPQMPAEWAKMSDREWIDYLNKKHGWKIGQPDIMKKRYGKSRRMRPFRRKRRLKRRKNRFRKKKYYGRKTAKKMARSIQPYLGETKIKSMDPVTVTPVVCTNTTITATPICDATLFSTIAAGVGDGQMVGLEITLKNITLFFEVVVTSTTYTLHPMRLIVIKSKTQASQCTANEMGRIVQDNLYMNFPWKPGFGKVIHDIVIPPILPIENEFNSSGTLVKSFKVNIPMNKDIRLDPRDNTELSGTANIYCLILRSQYLPGTNTAVPVITMRSLWYYKDA
jgi:hypothetical protein